MESVYIFNVNFLTYQLFWMKEFEYTHTFFSNDY